MVDTIEGGNIPRYFRKKWRILLKVEIYLDILGRNGGYYQKIGTG